MKKGYGAPTAGTIGNVGDFYVDLNSDALYKLIKVVPEEKEMQFVTRSDRSEKTQYVWEKVGAPSGSSVETCTVAFCVDSYMVESSFVSIRYSALVDGVITTKKVTATDDNFFTTYTDVVKGTIFFVETAKYFQSSYGDSSDYEPIKDVNSIFIGYIINSDGRIDYWND